MKELVFATNNKNKVAEVEVKLHPLEVERLLVKGSCAEQN